MKIPVRVALTLSLLALFHPSLAQSKKELGAGYYVVVGAYAATRENVAQNYVDVLVREGYTADYGFNSSRNLYYVYLRYFDNLKNGLETMQQTRKAGKFTDAWVRVIPGIVSAPNPVATDPQKVKKEKDASSSVPSASTAPESDVEEIKIDIEVNLEVIEDNPEIAQYEKMTLGNTEVFLSLYNSRNNRIIDGDVQVIDTERSKQLTKVKGNEYLLLPDPKSKSGQLTLICEAFGFRKLQHEINYPLPLADTVKPHIDLMGTTLVVNFDMVRYHKGDITTLYNVYFFNDASVMLPESKYELSTLLEMMQENSRYRIRLHGHTNGNYHGKIIAMGTEKNFFSLDGSKQTVGSAKDLSRNRAEVIKEYLTSNGISEDRIEIKAWGGKRPLYDHHSVNAKKNVRVEVEILEE